MQDELLAEILGQSIGIPAIRGSRFRRRIDCGYPVAGGGSHIDQTPDSVPASRLQNGKSSIHVRSKIRLRLLYRRHDVGPRREMENAVHALARVIDRSFVGDV